MEEHPFTKPEGSDAEMFIQWKGTELCADFTCSCGTEGHIDASFAHFVACPSCGAVYEMGTQVIAKRIEAPGGNVVTFQVATDEPSGPPVIADPDRALTVLAKIRERDAGLLDRLARGD